MTSPLAVLDAHQHHGHVFHSAVAEEVGDGGTPAGWLEREVAQRRAAMAAHGITRAVVQPGSGYLRPDGLADTRRVNDGIRAYCDADPVRFPYGLAVVEPLYGAAGLAEVRRARELGLVGVAYHARFQGVPTDHLWIHRHLEVMGELGMVPFVHAHGDSTLEAPLLVGNLAAAHPDLTIVVLDGCTGYHHTLECVALAEAHPNLLFDTAMMFNVLALQLMVQRVGARRLVFGSDLYSYPNTFVTAVTPTAVAAAGCTDAEVAAILGGTLDTLLGAARG